MQNFQNRLWNKKMFFRGKRDFSRTAGCFWRNTVAMLGISSVWLFSALATSDALAGQAYLWAQDANASSPYTAHNLYSYNSAGADNEVQRVGVGQYMLRLRGVNDGNGGGNMQVSTFGDTSNHCKLSSWYPIGDDINARVRCYSRHGSLVDQRFTALFASYNDSWPSGAFAAHFWANQHQLDAPYSPSARYYYNSANGATTIERRSTGVYRVTLSTPEQQLLRSPVINVTAYGADDARCGVDYKDGGDSLDQYQFIVSCMNGSGAEVDSRFTASVLQATTAIPHIEGAGVAALYDPRWSTSSNPPRRENLEEEGLMRVVVPDLPPWGGVIVNGGVHRGVYCGVIDWSWSDIREATIINIRCRDRNHRPVWQDFDLQFLSNPNQIFRGFRLAELQPSSTEAG